MDCLPPFGCHEYIHINFKLSKSIQFVILGQLLKDTAHYVVQCSLCKNSCNEFLLKFIIEKKFVSVGEVKVLLFFSDNKCISFIISLYSFAVGKLSMEVNAISQEEKARNHELVPGGT